jgi:2-keto-4-pentenoate hydratase/2-oxohepta-3-ene-1,7-dioic acid hydratase in catechol pathway
MNAVQFRNGRSYTVSKIIGVGRNYAAHAVEMNTRPPEDPILFIKPPTSLADIRSPLAIPQGHGQVHYELELAVCIGKEARRTAMNEALEFVAGYGMALDLTLRDMQKAAKDKGWPWAVAKGFDLSCPVSEFCEAADITDVNNLEILLKLNGEIRQQASTSLMLFKVEQLISYISTFFTLLPGDLILTGTPAGVGALASGDEIEASISEISSVKTTVG